jgi:hypothetical protein
MLDSLACPVYVFTISNFLNPLNLLTNVPKTIIVGLNLPLQRIQLTMLPELDRGSDTRECGSNCSAVCALLPRRGTRPQRLTLPRQFLRVSHMEA